MSVFRPRHHPPSPPHTRLRLNWGRAGSCTSGQAGCVWCCYPRHMLRDPNTPALFSLLQLYRALFMNGWGGGLRYAPSPLMASRCGADVGVPVGEALSRAEQQGSTHARRRWDLNYNTRCRGCGTMLGGVREGGIPPPPVQGEVQCPISIICT